MGLKAGRAKPLLFLIFLLVLSCYRPVRARTETYVGSKESNVYHYSSCRYAEQIKPENMRYFSSPEKAIAAGYRPCLVCDPPTESPKPEPPTISVKSPENRTYSTSNISLAYTVSESATWVGYSLDRGKNVTISGDTLLTGLTQGAHRIRVYANSRDNLYGKPDEVHFTIAIPPRPVTLNNPTNVTGNSVSLAWTKSLDVDFKNYTVYQSSTQGILGTPVQCIIDKSADSLAISGIKPSSSFYFTVRVYDKTGLYTDSNTVQTATAIPEFSSGAVALVLMMLSLLVVVSLQRLNRALEEPGTGIPHRRLRQIAKLSIDGRDQTPQ
jgi:hypothetical protein